MHNEAHEAGCNHGVYYPEVPADPPLLDGGERRVVDAYAGVELCRRRLDGFSGANVTLLEKYIQ